MKASEALAVKAIETSLSIPVTDESDVARIVGVGRAQHVVNEAVFRSKMAHA
jgi:hypothetical protein